MLASAFVLPHVGEKERGKVTIYTHELKVVIKFHFVSSFGEKKKSSFAIKKSMYDVKHNCPNRVDE